MDRYQFKDAIRSLLPSSRLMYRALAIIFLLALVVSCWPQALAKIPFIPSVPRDLQGTWDNGSTYVMFDGPELHIDSINFCYGSHSQHRVVIADHMLTFSESVESQSYRMLPSLGDWLAGDKPVLLVIDSPGPIPPGIYRYTTEFISQSDCW